MPMYGADVGQLRTLAQRMELAARSLDSIAASLHSQVQGARWDGADGVRFSSDWSRRYRPDLREVARRLDDAAKVIRRNALDQERTSSASGGARSRGSRFLPNYGLPVQPKWGHVLPFRPPWLLEWFGPGGTLPPRLSLPQDQIEALVREFSSGGLLIGGASGAIYDWALKSNHLAAVGDWMKVGDGVGLIGDSIGAFTGGWRLAEAIDKGDVDGGIRAGLDISWAVASKVPIVGAMKGSWDIGWFIGDRIYDVGEVTGVNDAVENSIIDQAIAKGHGSDIGTRYDGIPGFGNYVKDSGSAFVGRLKFW